MPGRIDKTVFISYRRTNVPWALAIYQNLTTHGYDVFFDYQNIDSGNFEKIILENIKTRAHFLVILTASALERCNEPGDWLRREIETAIDEKRNIVPLLLESFDFGSPLIKDALTGKLASLNQFNGLRVYSEYFFEAMDKLRERYLNVTLADISLHTLNYEAKEITESQKSAASEAPLVAKEELTAQEWFERGYAFQDAENHAEAVRCYTEAIRLEPDFATAYVNRGASHSDNNDLEGALADYEEAIRLVPNYAEAYMNRGIIRSKKNDLEGALEDFDRAIQLRPDLAMAYINRSNIHQANNDLRQALADLEEAIRLKPDYAEAYLNRGNIRGEKKDLWGALADYDEAIRLRPEFALAYVNRGALRTDNKDLKGALADYDEAIRLKPDFAEAYYNRALVWEKKKELSSAITDYQEYLKLVGDTEGRDQELEKKIKKLASNLAKGKSPKKKSK